MFSPLIVLGSSQRCGTTLLQRLLSSHSQVRIWGEHEGVLTQLLRLRTRLRNLDEKAGKRSREELVASGYHGFLANLLPDRNSIDCAVRSFILQMFAHPAEAEGRPIWGFKEVRYCLTECLTLKELFPETRIVHIVRNPRDILRSFDYWERTASGWNRTDTKRAIRHWARATESLSPHRLRDYPFILHLRYEDIVSSPLTASAKIANHCGLELHSFDMTVWERRVHTYGPGGDRPRVLRAWTELGGDLTALLDSDELVRAAESCAYRLS